jgi:hypothetical protein
MSEGNFKEKEKLVAGPRWAPDTKTDWPTDCRSQINCNFNFMLQVSRYQLNTCAVKQKHCFFLVSENVCFYNLNLTNLNCKYDNRLGIW